MSQRPAAVTAFREVRIFRRLDDPVVDVVGRQIIQMIVRIDEPVAGRKTCCVGRTNVRGAARATRSQSLGANFREVRRIRFRSTKRIVSTSTRLHWHAHKRVHDRF